ncbi:FKBP-type peptidyl-prolyl cis-trans isomerase [Ornithobacterium rhinotracheale]
MKKIFLALSVAAVFVACKNNDSKVNSEASQEGLDASYAFGMTLAEQIEGFKNNPANKDSINYSEVEKGVKDYFNNEEKMSSYAYGINIAKQINGVLENEMLKDGLSRDEIIKGFSDYLNKKETRIKKDSVEIVMTSYANNQQKKMQLEQAKEAKENKEKGKEFIAEKTKDPAVKTTQSGLAYKVLNEGSGDNVKIGDHVKIKYTGKTIDGKVFDSSEQNQPEGIDFLLQDGALIPGWVEGLQLMKVGSKYEFYIPAELAYGDSKAGEDIAPGSTLIFDVEVVSKDTPKE